MGYTVTFRRDEVKAAILDACDAGVTAAASYLADRAVEMLNGPSPSSPGTPPGLDSGNLSRSIRYVGPESLGRGAASFGTAVPYGRSLEFGAFITPKRSKYLAVPVDRAAVQKLQRRVMSPSKWSYLYMFTQRTRNIPGLRYIPPGRGKKHGGRLVLESSLRGIHVRGGARKTRTASAGKTMFVLKDSVVIRPRPWITRTALMNRNGAIDAAIGAATRVMKSYGGAA